MKRGLNYRHRPEKSLNIALQKEINNIPGAINQKSVLTPAETPTEIDTVNQGRNIIAPNKDHKQDVDRP